MGIREKDSGQQVTFNGVTREVPEFVELDMSHDSEFLDRIWSELKHDSRFVELRHAILLHALKKYEGTTPEAVSNYDAFIDGAVFATAVIISAFRSTQSDQSMARELEQNNPQAT